MSFFMVAYIIGGAIIFLPCNFLSFYLYLFLA